MPATIEYFPFDNQASFEDQWRDMAETWQTTGIIVQGGGMDSAGGDCAVSPGTGLQIEIGTGKAWIKGHMFKHTVDSEFLPISSNSSGTTRTDLVVIRADFTANTIGYEVLEGTTTPVQNSTNWDLPIASVSVASGAVSLATTDITDMRVTSNHADFSPLCIIRNSANTTIADGANTTLTWDTSDNNPMGMYDASMTDRITIKEDGIYEVTCNTVWSNPASTSGTRRIIVLRNRVGIDTAIAYGSAVGSSSLVDVGITASRIIELVKDDYLFVNAYNNSGASVDVKNAGLYSPVFSVVKISEAGGIS